MVVWNYEQQMVHPFRDVTKFIESWRLFEHNFSREGGNKVKFFKYLTLQQKEHNKMEKDTNADFFDILTKNDFQFNSVSNDNTHLV